MPDWSAILPAAGLGERMHAVTGGNPKETLPLGNTTIIQRVLNEAKDTRPTVVTSPLKGQMNALLTELGVRLCYQNQPSGLGDAILLAAAPTWTIILLPDTVFFPRSPVQDLQVAVEEGWDGAIATEQVDEKDVTRYGIIEAEPDRQITLIKEKPRPEETPSRQAIAGRYAFSPETMDLLTTFLADCREFSTALNNLVKEGCRIKAVPCTTEEKRYDCGSPAGYAEALKAVK